MLGSIEGGGERGNEWHRELHPDLTLTARCKVLVALNRKRADEEQRGVIRWLRPDFQNPDGAALEPEQAGLALPGAGPACGGKKSADRGRSALPRWPAELPARFAAVRLLITEADALGDASVLSARFGRKSAKREKQIAEILQTMEAMGAG